jgi:hypothetical protein
MCIYCGTNKYRKIYENHYGSIPRDPNGKSYHIHHKDNNHNNNDPLNLIAVTALEHFNIHESQRDYGACYFLMRQHLNKSSQEISEICKKSTVKRISASGYINPFSRKSDDSSVTSIRTVAGLNPLSKRSDGTSVASDRVRAGHNLNGINNPRYDKTIYSFENIKTKEIVNLTKYEFMKTYNLYVYNITSGRKICCGDWKLASVPNLESDIIRSFENKYTGEIVHMSSSDLRKTYNLHSGAVSQMIRNKISSVKGWHLKK